MIAVTKSFLPPIEDYTFQIQRVFKNQWLTNRGELTLELEKKIQEKFKLDNIIITNNGTIPLQIALKVLGNKGEIITTPFSYIATTSSILWENCTPVFVDIDKVHLTIDEKLIEEKITNKTTAILATHVFGNPCEVEAIEKIAIKHNLKVIYDAAHCFGVEYKGKSIFNFGDVSTCSFHATKIFHTGEGGAIFCKDIELYKKFFYSHNFGHRGPEDFQGVGINGKISELQSAMGLAIFPYLDQIFENRRNAVEYYFKKLLNSKLQFLKIRENTKWNFSYFPVVFNSETELLKIVSKLKEQEIYPRRYFYPSINTIDFINGGKMVNSEEISKKILCLPLSSEIKNSEIDVICEIIISNL